MTELIALRSNMYAYKTKESETKKLNAISKHVVTYQITFDDYKQSLFENVSFCHKMRRLRSDNHKMFVEEVEKKSLCPFDDKRYLIDHELMVPFGCDNVINYYNKV